MPEDIELTGNDLTSPPPEVNFTLPETPETPTDFNSRVISPVVRGGQAFLDQFETDSTRDYDRAFKEYTVASTQDAPSFEDRFQSRLDSFGTPDAIKELRQVNSQLVDMDTQRGVQNVQIAEGNSLGQAQREVTQNDREAAVRSAGLAAKSALLQGNIDQAQSLARDSANFAFQDKQAELSALKTQLQEYARTAGNDKATIIAERNRIIDEEQANLDELKGTVADAIASGAASANDLAQLSNPNMSDEDKRSLAQGIIGRGAAEERNANLAAKYTSNRRNLLDLALKGDQQSIDQLGYNPNDTGSTPEELRQYETESGTIVDNISRAEELLANSLGIKSSAGAFQPDTIGGFFTGSSSITPDDGVLKNLFKYVPVIGNLIGSSETSSQKGDFLSGVSYIVNNNTFDKLTELKRGGATFGSLSDPERVAIGRAASDLAASTITNEQGDITGFRGSEEKLVQNIQRVMQGYDAAQEQLNIEYGLTTSEREEGINIWNQ